MAWQRPTLPCLKTKYHRRWEVSRPSSEWDRVGASRNNHQANKNRIICDASRSCVASASAFGFIAAHAVSRNQVNRAISTGKLHALPHFHTRPINVVVFHGSQGRTSFEAGFPLRCFQRLSFPNVATLRCSWQNNRYTRGSSIPVLSY